VPRSIADYLALGIDPPDAADETDVLDEPAVTAYTDLPSTAWTLRPEGSLARRIICLRGSFPGGAGNVEATGVFGWVEPPSLKTWSGVTDADLTAASTTLKFAGSVAGLAPRDIMIVGDSLAIMVNSIDITNKQIGFDALTGVLPATIAKPVAAKCYGAPPYLIEEATQALVQYAVARRRNWQQGSVIDQTNLRREKTDRYEWEAAAGPGGANTATGWFGIPVVDELLRDFMAGAELDTL
jgi:hypothetical protein